MGKKQIGLCGRYALFHIYNRTSKGLHLCRVLDVQGDFVFLQNWSLHKNEPLLGMPALYPISVLAAPNSLPWKPTYFDEDYLEQNPNTHVAQLFEDWKSAKGEYEIEMKQLKAKANI